MGSTYYRYVGCSSTVSAECDVLPKMHHLLPLHPGQAHAPPTWRLVSLDPRDVLSSPLLCTATFAYRSQGLQTIARVVGGQLLLTRSIAKPPPFGFLGLCKKALVARIVQYVSWQCGRCLSVLAIRSYALAI